MTSDFELITNNTDLIEKVIKNCKILALAITTNADTLGKLTEKIRIFEARIARLESKGKLD